MLKVNKIKFTGEFYAPHDAIYEVKKGETIETKKKLVITPYRKFEIVGGNYDDGYIDIKKVIIRPNKEFLFKVYYKNRKKKDLQYTKKFLMSQLIGDVIDEQVDTTTTLTYAFLNQIASDLEHKKKVKPSYIISLKR